MVNNFVCTAGLLDKDLYNDKDTIVIFLCKECVDFLDTLQLPADIYAIVEKYISRYDDFSDIGAINTLILNKDNKLLNIVLAGCGKGSECKPYNFRKVAGGVARVLKKMKAAKALVVAPLLLNENRGAYVSAIVEGVYLGAYTFDKYKSNQKISAICSIYLATAVPNAKELVNAAEVMASAVCYTRDLVNQPGNAVIPETLAEAAIELGKNLPLEINVLDEVKMADLKMNAILAVGQGSSNPARMISLRYQGAADAPYIAFVGKGITFDSGGISIKPDDNMGEMKDDMAGAGAVLGALKAIAELKLKCNVIGILACAENMPSGNAQRPGDIVKAANGKTIEVISTDAEGRMVLADGVWYACRLGAKKVIDIATLTGGVIVALGQETSGIIANDQDLVSQIITAGKYAGESLFQLPSLPECKEAIKSDVADLKNSAGRAASAITGGLFIGEFVDENIPWAHIDIGGTSTSEKTEGFKIKGGTGFGTLTLIKLAGML